METISLKPERKAQLDEYAQRHGQDPATALDDVLAACLEWDRQDFDEAVDGICRGVEDVKAGRTRPAGEFFAAVLAARYSQRRNSSHGSEFHR
jgi:predicted transcriptional regulator